MKDKKADAYIKALGAVGLTWDSITYPTSVGYTDYTLSEKGRDQAKHRDFDGMGLGDALERVVMDLPSSFRKMVEQNLANQQQEADGE